MGLIKVKEYGFGFNGSTLDLTILVPKNSYLGHFKVATHKEFKGEDGIYSIKGRDLISDDPAKKREDFDRLFVKIGELQDEQGNMWDEYTLNTFGPDNFKGCSIMINQKDLTFLIMELYEPSFDTSRFKISCDCGMDNLVTIFPIYDLMPLRLCALQYAPTPGCSCDVPREFLDKILQIKAIELALCTNRYCDAALYWKMFYSKEVAMPNKKCGCNG